MARAASSIARSSAAEPERLFTVEVGVFDLAPRRLPAGAFCSTSGSERRSRPPSKGRPLDETIGGVRCAAAGQPNGTSVRAHGSEPGFARKLPSLGFAVRKTCV